MASPRTSSISIALLALFLSGSAQAIWGDSDEEFGVDGSLRTITAGTYNYGNPALFGEDNPGDGMSQTMLRLTIGGRPADWLTYEIHGVQSLSFSSMAGTTVQGPVIFGTQGVDTRYLALDAAWDWADESDIQARLYLDRCNFKITLPFADVTIGRQAVTFGKAYFWNPLDVFLAFDPRQFDRDYKAGVDALRIDIPLGDFSGVTLVGVLGRRLEVGLAGVGYTNDDVVDASWHGSALVARVYTNLFEWDWAYQGGKVYGGYQVGAAASGEVWKIAVRLEAAYLFAVDSEPLPFFPNEDEIESHLTAVVGLGHRFENTLQIEMEYLYNGSGDPDNLEAALMRMMSGGSYHLGEHLLGVVATYEILPILNGSLAWIFSISDQSSLIQPGLSLSVSDEADFIFGAMIGLGARPGVYYVLGEPVPDFKSEFGTYPNIYYMEFKFYF
jgi:hypothetical protein